MKNSDSFEEFYKKSLEKLENEEENEEENEKENEEENEEMKAYNERIEMLKKRYYEEEDNYSETSDPFMDNFMSDEEEENYNNQNSIYLLVNEKKISMNIEKERVEDIKTFFSVDIKRKKLIHNINQIKEFDPFITPKDKEMIEKFIKSLSLDQIKDKLLNEYRYDEVKNNKNFLQTNIYICERNKIVSENYIRNKKKLPKRLLEIEDEIKQELINLEERLNHNQYWNLYRLYYKHLEKDPKNKSEEEMIRKLMKFYNKKCLEEHVKRTLGIFEEPKDEFATWGKDREENDD